jgi:hypothetical protein
MTAFGLRLLVTFALADKGLFAVSRDVAPEIPLKLAWVARCKAALVNSGVRSFPMVEITNKWIRESIFVSWL